MKVVMGCAIYHDWHNIKARKSHELIRDQSKHEVAYLEVAGMNTEIAKQVMYKEFLKTDADYFFNVDFDIVFLNPEINPIDRLISLNKDIVGGIYVLRNPVARPTYRPLDLQKEYESTGKFPENYVFKIPNKVFEVEWISGGCAMIKREVIEKLTKKYAIPNLPSIHKGEYLPEDFSFFKRARDEGYTIWADPAIKLGHLGTYVYTLNDYKK